MEAQLKRAEFIQETFRTAWSEIIERTGFGILSPEQLSALVNYGKSRGLGIFETQAGNGRNNLAMSNHPDATGLKVWGNDNFSQAVGGGWTAGPPSSWRVGNIQEGDGYRAVIKAAGENPLLTSIWPISSSIPLPKDLYLSLTRDSRTHPQLKDWGKPDARANLPPFMLGLLSRKFSNVAVVPGFIQGEVMSGRFASEEYLDGLHQSGHLPLQDGMLINLVMSLSAAISVEASKNDWKHAASCYSQELQTRMLRDLMKSLGYLADGNPILAPHGTARDALHFFRRQ